MSAGASVDADRTVVLLGNDAPQMQVAILHPETGLQVGQRSVRAQHLRQSVTRVVMRPDFDHPETVDLALSTDNDRRLSMIGNAAAPDRRVYAVGVHELEEVVAVHAGGQKPSWVASSDPAFAEALAKHFGCPVTKFERVEGREIGGPTALLTTVGRDALHAQHVGTGAQPAAFTFMGVTQTATAPAASDTVLAGEIATAGLARGAATYAHTAGTNTSTLTRTFTAQAADVAGGAVVLAAYGIFNAGAGGTMAYHTPLNSTATLNVAGDNATVTETLTAG